MANESTKGNLTKSYLLKFSKRNNHEIIKKIEQAISQYQDYRDTLSKNIFDNLMTMKIGDLCEYIDNKSSIYYQICSNPCRSELPLYKMFTKFPDTNSRDNAFYEYVRKTVCDGYDGNALGLSETCFRKLGYMKGILANYVVKITAMKPDIRYSKLTPDSSDSDVMEQTIFDMFKLNLNSADDFDTFINHIKESEKCNDNLITRLETERNFLSLHKDEIAEKIVDLNIKRLSETDYIKANRSNQSMTLGSYKFSIIRCDDSSYDYMLHLPVGSKSYDIRLKGNRQIITTAVEKNTGIEFTVERVDICKKHANTITLVKKNGEFYAKIMVTSNFAKRTKDISKAAGIDINTKHMMMATSIIDDGNIKGYANIYKHLCENPDFYNNVNKETLDIYRDMAKSVNFCPIESNALFARYCKQVGLKYSNTSIAIENALSSTFDYMMNLYEKDERTIFYLRYVKMLRAKIKSHFVLAETYKRMQKEFDLRNGYDSTDKSYDNPFARTPEGIQIRNKMNNVLSDIIGCRDNIIDYAYHAIHINGYDTIALENLTSSQFETMKMKSPKSLLDYHKFRGMKLGDVKNNTSINFTYDNYIYHTDDVGCVTDIEYSEKGKLIRTNNLFYNLLIKAIGFASIKDRFVVLSNSGRVNIALIPSYYSSQMDSINHKAYYIEKEVKDKNGNVSTKTVRADKSRVRTTQEKHINGLNADFNAACNLSYIVECTRVRKEFCSVPSNPQKYCIPILNASKKSPDKFYEGLKKLDMVENIECA